MNPQPQQAVNPIPAVILLLFAVIIGVEGMFFLGAQGWIGGPMAIGWRSIAIQDYTINGLIVTWMVQNDIYPWEQLLRFVSYAFVHGNFTHAIFAAVMLLALGKFVAERFHSMAVLAVFFSSSILGALAYALMADEGAWLMGAFPGVYGLIGAFTYIMRQSLAARGAQQWRAFSLIGFLMAIQLLFGMLFGASNTWLADLVGFVTGFIVSIFVSPGGWPAMVARLRSMGR